MTRSAVKRWASKVRKLRGWAWFDDDTAAMLAALMEGR